MKTIVDARGLACPEPVLLVRKAIAGNDEVTVIVDNETAVENIRRLATKAVFAFAVTEKGEGWEISLIRTAAAGEPQAAAGVGDAEISCDAAPAGERGPFVVALADNRMGRGDDVLGDVLIRAFVHTLAQRRPLPATLVCYNAGVKLAATDSPVLDDLEQMARDGVEIMVCGTCVNYFDLGQRIGVGRVSNMYDILEAMAGAGRLVRP